MAILPENRHFVGYRIDVYHRENVYITKKLFLLILRLCFLKNAQPLTCILNVIPDLIIKISINYTLNLNKVTSPSCITYSFPSDLTSPFSFAVVYVPQFIKSSYETISALMKPLSKSL